MIFSRRVQAFDRQIRAAPVSQSQGSGRARRASPPTSLSPGRNAEVPNRSWASTATTPGVAEAVEDVEEVGSGL
jgi:hypothetical protein